VREGERDFDVIVCVCARAVVYSPPDFGDALALLETLDAASTTTSINKTRSTLRELQQLV
jgi:hypothetical protein